MGLWNLTKNNIFDIIKDLYIKLINLEYPCKLHTGSYKHFNVQNDSLIT